MNAKNRPERSSGLSHILFYKTLQHSFQFAADRSDESERIHLMHVFKRRDADEIARHGPRLDRADDGIFKLVRKIHKIFQMVQLAALSQG